MPSPNITSISIPKPLAEKIKKRIEKTGFNSVSSYITYVLRQVLSTVEKQESPSEDPKEAFSKEDEDIVKARLKSLGYLD